MGNKIRQHTFPEIKRELMSRHSIRPLSALLALLALHELLLLFVLPVIIVYSESLRKYDTAVKRHCTDWCEI